MALTCALVATPAFASSAAGTPLSAAAKAERPRIAEAQWSGDAGLAAGRRQRVDVRAGRAKIAAKPRIRRLDGTRLATGRWTSPWVTPGFGFTELIPSWHARTPGTSSVIVEVRGRTAAGTRSSWDTVARWAAGKKPARTSYGVQSDDLGRLAVDTWQTSSPDGLNAWQVRFTLAKKPTAKRSPSLWAVTAMASRAPADAAAATSTPPRPGVGVELDVPDYSQMIHRGHSPQWGGGGQAWCSPTSTAMVLGYYGRLPGAGATAWVGAGHPDPWVDEVARRTFDHGYNGTGNWTFNTAYAARRTGAAYVTRLTDLARAEDYLRAGIPLVASISFRGGALTGAPISTTAGHLVVITGIRANGDVIVNDPAARTDGEVRRVYRRGEFEDAWLGGSGGIVYVITDAAHPVP